MTSEHSIWRDEGKTMVGRIVVDGTQMRLDRRNPIDDSFVCIGYYEDLNQPANLDRKLSEIESVFSEWARCAERLQNPAGIKASWTAGLSTPPEHRRSDSETAGAVVVRHAGVEIARIYKYTESNTARWVRTVLEVSGDPEGSPRAAR